MNASNNHILKSFSLNKNSGWKEASDAGISDQIKSKNLAWVHLDANNPKSKKWLTEECNYLDSIVINGLLAEETRPRIERIEDGIFLILRCVNLNENSDPEDMVSVRMWIDAHRIITIQKRNVASINDMEQIITSEYAPTNSGDFLCILLANIFKNMEPIFGALDDNLDDIEEEIIKEPKTDLRNQLSDIRQQTIIFRRYIAPQKDIISNLCNSDCKWITALHKRRLKETNEHVIRYVEELDSVRDKSQIIKDELSNLLTDRINKNMYVLSIISAVFLPLTFLTGLLGANISGIPGSENPNAFFIFSAILFIVILLQLILFRKMKWI